MHVRKNVVTLRGFTTRWCGLRYRGGVLRVFSDSSWSQGLPQGVSMLENDLVPGD